MAETIFCAYKLKTVVSAVVLCACEVLRLAYKGTGKAVWMHNGKTVAASSLPRPKYIWGLQRVKQNEPQVKTAFVQTPMNLPIAFEAGNPLNDWV